MDRTDYKRAARDTVRIDSKDLMEKNRGRSRLRIGIDWRVHHAQVRVIAFNYNGIASPRWRSIQNDTSIMTVGVSPTRLSEHYAEEVRAAAVSSGMKVPAMRAAGTDG